MSHTSDVDETMPSVSDPIRFPPGTILLENFAIHTGHGGGHLVLSPTPSDDPNDPLNWTKARKFVNFAIISFYTLMIFVVLDVGAVCWGIWAEEFGVDATELTNVYASNLAGLALGCVFFIPFALKFGRRPVYLASVVVSFAATIWQAKANNLSDLIGSAVVGGLAGAASEALVQMTVADVFFVHQRGTLNGIYLFFVTTGAYLGPVASGYIVDGQDWRWLYWWCAIFLGVSILSFIFFYEDTKFRPTLIGQPSQPPSQTSDGGSGKEDVPSYMQRVSSHHHSSIPLKTYRQRMALVTVTPGSPKTFLRHVYQPFMVLATIPAVAFTALQYGSVLAWFAVLATTQAVIFVEPPYNFSPSGIGLLSLPAFIGSLFGVVYGGPLSDMSILFFTKRNKGIYEPEMRLYMNALPALLGPAGIWLFGYSAMAGMPWIVPCVGIAFFGFSLTALTDTSLTYLSDSYQEILGDGLVGVAFVRNGLSMVITFALSPWINAIGFQKMFLCSGFLCLAINLLFVLLVLWGKRLRVVCAGRYSSLAKKQFDARAV